MLTLMLIGMAVMVVVLLYVVIHKRPVVNNVGLADPSTWHAQPTAPAAPPTARLASGTTPAPVREATTTVAPAIAPPIETAPGIVTPPAHIEPEQAADQW